MPESHGAPLASLRDAVIFILGSGGVGRVATAITGLYLASLQLAPALPLKSKEYYQLMLCSA
jgi:integral membrane sensor domain MASE1